MGGVYLHIGLGKTGTTAVQFWLDANRERLASHGWHYPKIGFFERGRAHHALSHKWGGWISPNLLDGRDIDAEWRRLANTILTSEDNFIVSSENFATAARSNAQVVPFITRTLQGIDTKIILYLRRPDELAEAVYRQMVKAGLTLQPIDRFIEDLPPEFDFEAVIRDWEEGFGKQNVIVRWYQPERWPEGDIVQDFCQAVGIRDDPEFTKSERENVRITAAAVRAIISGKIKKRRLIYEAIRANAGSDEPLLCDSRRAKILKRYSFYNAR